jgi:hypothetical protein
MAKSSLFFMDVAASDLTSHIVLQRSSAERAEDFAEGRAHAISVHATAVLLSGLITFSTAWLRARILKRNITYFGSRFVPFVTLERAAAMSALGQKRTFRCQRAMSALPPKADIQWLYRYIRFVP